jgi:hypothetical protein
MGPILGSTAREPCGSSPLGLGSQDTQHLSYLGSVHPTADGHRAQMMPMQFLCETSENRMLGVSGDTLDNQLSARDTKGQR